MDVVCGIGDVGFGALIENHREKIRSVGVYTVNGIDTCSGALVNTTNNDNIPYFLTANHSGISSLNAQSVVVYWNFENSFCRTPGSSASGQTGDGSTSFFNSGTIFRSTYYSRVGSPTPVSHPGRLPLPPAPMVTRTRVFWNTQSAKAPTFRRCRSPHPFRDSGSTVGVNTGQPNSQRDVADQIEKSDTLSPPSWSSLNLTPISSSPDLRMPDDSGNAKAFFRISVTSP